MGHGASLTAASFNKHWESKKARSDAADHPWMGELEAQPWACASTGIWKEFLMGPVSQNSFHPLLLDFSRTPAPLKHKVVDPSYKLLR